MGPLQQAFRDLGMAAITQAATMAKLIAQGSDPRAFKAVISEQMDKLCRAAIVFTGRLTVVCDLSTAETARELEEKMAGLEGLVEETPAFQRAVENLIESAKTYASRMAQLAEHCAKTGATPSEMGSDTHEQAYKLARAAVTFTLERAITLSADAGLAREVTAEMEERLAAKLDEAYAPPRNCS